MAAWEQAFRRHGLQVAQVLLTGGDLADRRRRRTPRDLPTPGPGINERHGLYPRWDIICCCSCDLR
jgi:hypothetical protein